MKAKNLHTGMMIVDGLDRLRVSECKIGIYNNELGEMVAVSCIRNDDNFPVDLVFEPNEEVTVE